MNWQVKYALANIAGQPQFNAEHVEGDLIRIAVRDQPDVLAVISAADAIDAADAASFVERYPEMDFLCGYRSTCIWHGNAIQFLEEARVGWGSAGTLTSAALSGQAKIASHKTYSFSDRLLRQYGRVQNVIREFDRIHSVTLRSGAVFRIGMIGDYEPTADAVRSLWEIFGPVDIAWNINPNGNPTPEAIKVGIELGCEVLKWEELRERLRTA